MFDSTTIPLFIFTIKRLSLGTPHLQQILSHMRCAHQEAPVKLLVQSFHFDFNLTGLAVSRSHLISRMFTRILIPVKPPDSASCPDDAKVQNGYRDPASEVARCVNLLEYDQG
jgi:hypothetical protein